jgi:predicted HicB family RNase H-like nuclease
MNRDLLNYKGYLGLVRFVEDEGVFRGRVVNIQDTVTFQGKSVDELRREFQSSVDDYLAFCKDLGEEADKPFSGRLTLRMKPATHRTLKTLAQIQGQSLNHVVTGILNREARKVERLLNAVPSSTSVTPDPENPGPTKPAGRGVRKSSRNSGG